MPFRPIDTLAADPDVQIIFHGLLLLRPDDDGNICNIGVHRQADNHFMSVIVRRQIPDSPDDIMLRLFGPLENPLSITVDPPANLGVAKYTPTNGPFDRTDGNNDSKDFRYCFDFKDFHPQIEIDSAETEPGIRVTDAVFFSATVTDPTKLAVILADSQNSATDLHRIAGKIGAAIEIPDNGTCVLNWQAGAAPLVLPKGDKYVIEVENSPMVLANGNLPHSEFAEYYKVTNVPQAERLDLTFQPLNPKPKPLGTDAAPCMPVGVGG